VWLMISARLARCLGSVTSIRDIRFLHSVERLVAI
jgi:hypothetical protein